jgi:hypothetical protein
VAAKVLVVGGPVCWFLLPDVRWILKNFYVGTDGIHRAVIHEDKAFGVSRIVLPDELEAM